MEEIQSDNLPDEEIVSEEEETVVDDNVNDDLLPDAVEKEEETEAKKETPEKEEPFLVDHDGKQVPFNELPLEVQKQVWQNHIQKTEWQKHLTQKNQSIAELEKELKSKVSEAEKVFGRNSEDRKNYDAYRSWLIAHPDVAQDLMTKMQQDPTYAPLPQQTVNPELEEIRRKTEEIESKLQVREQDAILENVVSQYKDYGITAEEVDKYMLNYKDGGLDFADMSDLFAKAYLWETKMPTLIKNAQQTGTQNVIRKKSASVDKASTPASREAVSRRKRTGDLHTDLMRHARELIQEGEWDL